VNAVPANLVLCALVSTGVTLHGAGLHQQAYVWQRAWTEPVRQAVVAHGSAFERLIVLKAEVSWHGDKPQLVQVPIDYPTLVKTKRPIGLALRIGPYAGSFDRTAPSATYLADLAGKLVAEAKSTGLAPIEMQLDFDCASSKLGGYRIWVEVIRKRIAPVPLVITTLPSWLEQPTFKTLVSAADSYVLQVHSLERPKSFDATYSLCEPEVARRAVDKAAQVGVPFRVALPTYGYVIAFDQNGRFVGLSAEGTAKSWPANVRLKEIRANPLEMAEVVQGWSSNSPRSLESIIWYRLPVAGDILNWRWPTLSAILESRFPRKSVRAESYRVEPGLTEIKLVNDGELDISSRLAVQTRWSGARLVAGDGLRGFEMTEQTSSSARFNTGVQPHRLPAGDSYVIGWLRLSEDREVQVEMEEMALPK
jgi:hypothetical protein